MTGRVFDVQRFSTHDGPGIRTTVFLKGCPLHCWWCHNPESQAPGPEVMIAPGRCVHCGACVAACPQGGIRLAEEGATYGARCTVCGACVQVCCAGAREIAGREMTVGQVMAEVERDMAFYDESGGGLTVSGGEPLWQPEFLLVLLRACRERAIRTAVDTCGFASWDTLDRVRPYVDLFLYDVKLMDADRHCQLTGVSNELILSNLWALARQGHALVLRIPVIPGVNDDEENLRQTADLAASLPHVQQVSLLPYHHTALAKYRRVNRVYLLPDMRPPSAERMAEIAALFQRRGLNVKLGG